MTVFLIVLHVLVCLFLILFVLLQPGARGGVGAAFGGAGGQTVFGGRGANTFLAKLTAAAAVIFMVTSISLSYFVSHSSSVMKGRAAATEPAAEDKKADAVADGKAEAKAEAKADGAAAPASNAPAAPADAAASALPAAAAPVAAPTGTAPPASSQPAAQPAPLPQ